MAARSVSPPPGGVEASDADLELSLLEALESGDLDGPAPDARFPRGEIAERSAGGGGPVGGAGAATAARAVGGGGGAEGGGSGAMSLFPVSSSFGSISGVGPSGRGSFAGVPGPSGRGSFAGVPGPSSRGSFAGIPGPSSRGSFAGVPGPSGGVGLSSSSPPRSSEVPRKRAPPSRRHRPPSKLPRPPSGTPLLPLSSLDRSRSLSASPSPTREAWPSPSSSSPTGDDRPWWSSRGGAETAWAPPPLEGGGTWEPPEVGGGRGVPGSPRGAGGTGTREHSPPVGWGRDAQEGAPAEMTEPERPSRRGSASDLAGDSDDAFERGAAAGANREEKGKSTESADRGVGLNPRLAASARSIRSLGRGDSLKLQPKPEPSPDAHSALPPGRPEPESAHRPGPKGEPPLATAHAPSSAAPADATTSALPARVARAGPPLHVTALPPPLLSLAASGLSAMDLCSLSLVSRAFRRLASADALWKRLYALRWPRAAAEDEEEDSGAVGPTGMSPGMGMGMSPSMGMGMSPGMGRRPDGARGSAVAPRSLRGTSGARSGSAWPLPRAAAPAPGAPSAFEGVWKLRYARRDGKEWRDAVAQPEPIDSLLREMVLARRLEVPPLRVNLGAEGAERRGAQKAARAARGGEGAGGETGREELLLRLYDFRRRNGLLGASRAQERGARNEGGRDENGDGAGEQPGNAAARREAPVADAEPPGPLGAGTPTPAVAASGRAPGARVREAPRFRPQREPGLTSVFDAVRDDDLLSDSASSEASESSDASDEAESAPRGGARRAHGEGAAPPRGPLAPGRGPTWGPEPRRAGGAGGADDAAASAVRAFAGQGHVRAPHAVGHVRASHAPVPPMAGARASLRPPPSSRRTRLSSSRELPPGYRLSDAFPPPPAVRPCPVACAGDHRRLALDAWACVRCGALHVCDDRCDRVLVTEDGGGICPVSGHVFDRLVGPPAGGTAADDEEEEGGGALGRAFVAGYFAADQNDLLRSWM